MVEPQINVHYLPGQVAERELEGSAVVVIDLLRATTTICQALASGASEVVPFLEIEEAMGAADAAGRNGIVLGGERRGGKIPGFDVGNSPSEYTPAVVNGKRVYITTTNGTRAMFHARFAKRVLLGSFLNLSAVVASLKDVERIDIVCAGTDGKETGEDILAAGAIVYELCGADRGPDVRSIADSATTARDAWCSLLATAKTNGRRFSDELALALRETAGGRNLIGIGLDQDLVDSAQVDRLDIVAELDLRTWRITARTD